MKNLNNKTELENFVKDNKSFFDTELPTDGHFERFQDKLNSKRKPNKFLYTAMKYAAVIIIMLTSIFVFKDYFVQTNTNSFTRNSTNEDDSFDDISSFYNSQFEARKKEFMKISCKEGISEKQNVKKDIDELTKDYNELLAEYKNDPNNENLKNALISNYRLRIDTLGRIINSMKKYC